MKIEKPRFFPVDEKERAKAQHKLSYAEKGTPERANCRRAIQHIHQCILDQLKDYAHILSREWINRFGKFALEKLNGKKASNHFMAKSISDAAWNQRKRYSMHIAENVGRGIGLVDSRNTSSNVLLV